MRPFTNLPFCTFPRADALPIRSSSAIWTYAFLSIRQDFASISLGTVVLAARAHANHLVIMLCFYDQDSRYHSVKCISRLLVVALLRV